MKKLENRHWTAKKADFNENEKIVEVYGVQNKTGYEAIFSRDNIITLVNEGKIIFHSQSEDGPEFILYPVSGEIFIKIEDDNNSTDAIGSLPPLKGSSQDTGALREKSKKEIRKMIAQELEI